MLGERVMYEFGDVVSLRSKAGITWFKKKAWGLVYDGDSGLRVLLATDAESHRDCLAHISTKDLEWGYLPQREIGITDNVVPITESLIQERVGHINKIKADEILRSMAFRIMEKHYLAVHAGRDAFVPGETPVRYAARTYDAEEIKALVDSAMDFWLTAGRYSTSFAAELSTFLGSRYCILTNSGSSANLLAISALTSPHLGEKRCSPGDEVITTACAFPTTANPIIQNDLTPVFVDVEPGSYNVDPVQLEAAISKKTRAIFLTHTLGNPFDLDRVTSLAKKYDLWVIEDNCDALGSKYRGQLTGTFGDISTFSFYPAHHITTGEGGALVTSDPSLKRAIVSFRDWGRDCWCEPGHDNTCGRRYGWQLGQLPPGYDHKYIYSHLGYNLKMTEMQAAVGLAQMKKLPDFIKARRDNWDRLRQGLEEYEEFFILPEPAPFSEPSWFGFLLSVREDAPFSRAEIVDHLEKNLIATRMLFAGNLTRQPAFESVSYRISGELKHSDQAMNNAFWIGVYPGLEDARLDFVIEKFRDFIDAKAVKD